MRPFRSVAPVVLLLVPAGASLLPFGCSDSSGSAADAAVSDAPAADAPAPDAPVDAPVDAAPDAMVLSRGNPCGELPDGGSISGVCAEGLLCCPPSAIAQSVCADPSPANDAGIGVGQCPLPDLKLDQDRLRSELGFGMGVFSNTGCNVVEGCVAAPGLRRLLHFSVVTPNVGTADLYVGRPSPDNPLFTFSSCHNHYHFNGYALYRVLDQSGNVAVQGRKRAFCLEDFERQANPPLGGPGSAQYDCSDQGISKGWQDTYYNGLTCQFMDITGLAPGRYTLEVTVNPDRILPELNYDNNRATVTFDLGPQPQVPTDSCNGTNPAGDSSGQGRECGWTDGGTFTCTPGQQVHVGCAAGCGNLGSCTGDPMLRICDPGDEADGGTEPPCTADHAVAQNDDCSNSTNCSAVSFVCPASGHYQALWAPYNTSEAATCTLAHSP
jgi:hypothetical protein